VPEFGKIILSADNEGKGYSVDAQGGELVLNFNYEAAKSHVSALQKDYNDFKNQGYDISSPVTEGLNSGQEHLKNADKYLFETEPPDMKSAVAELDLSLKDTLLAHEQLYLDRANADIEKYRKGEATIKVIDTVGKLLSDCDIAFEQTSHDFDFAVASSSHDCDEQYTELLKQAGINTKYVYFSYGEVQPEAGKFDWSGPDNQVELQLKNGFKLIGDLGWFFYRAYWGSALACPTYLDSMSFDQIKESVSSYGYAVAERYKGKINIWESISEPCMFNQFKWTWNQKFEIYRVVALAIKEANPEATILSWNPSLSYQLQSYYRPEDVNLDEPAPGIPWESVSEGLPYQEFIRLATDYGVPIDLIGLHLENSGVNAYTQPMNFNVALDLVSISNMIDQYSSYGKPIFYRENQAPSTQVDGGNWWHHTWDEQTQAEYVKNFYTIAFGKPLMYGAGWSTGFVDDDSYTAGAISGGILNSDLTPKQAYYTLKELISSWTTSGGGKTDQNGEFKLRGFAGDYTISIQTSDGRVVDSTIHINEQKSREFTITVPAATKTTPTIASKTETSSQTFSTPANPQPTTAPKTQTSDSKSSILLILIIPAVLVVGFSILFFTRKNFKKS
jgi:endo-1,4-beta-xylanase